ncbi:MAG TPA: hypothetical protein VFF30_20125 [Nitrososphaerales archaeon]|nr:hypothetical protein [Nitrososphaerales archaeon]
MLAQVHVQVSIQTYTFSTEIGLLTKPANQSQAQLYQLRWFPSNGDAYWVLWPLFNTAAYPPAAYNYGFFHNTTIDNIVNQGLQTVNGRQTYFIQAQQRTKLQEQWVRRSSRTGSSQMPTLESL